MINRTIPIVAIILFLSAFIFGCDKQEKAYREAKEKDSIESYELFIKKYPNSKYFNDVKRKIKILVIRGKIQVDDPVEKTKAILALRDMEKTNELMSFIPNLISALKDSQMVQIVEGVTFTEHLAVVTGKAGGSIFFTSVRSEAAKTLEYITGESFGKDEKKWQKWWEENKENYTKER